MQRLKALLSEHLNALRDAVRHAPFETLVALFTAVTFSIAVGIDTNSVWRHWSKIIRGAVLLLPALLIVSQAAHTGRLAAKQRHVASGVLTVAGVLYALTFREHIRPREAWQFGLLATALWTLLLCAPLWTRRATDDETAWFWRANARLIGRLLTVGTFAGLLYAGLCLALAAVDALFDIGFGSDPYLHLFGATFMALVPALIVGGLPEMTAPVGSAPVVVPKAARWLSAYVLAPLLLIYVAILYAYNLKALVAVELPRNALSPLALGAAMVGLLAIAIRPPGGAVRGTTQTLSDRLVSFFPPLFLPLVPLPLWAVWIRVVDLGWTEFRVVRFGVLLVVGGLCIYGVTRRVRKQAFWVPIIPLVFAVLFGALSVGPWSASAIGIRSQTARLIDGLRAHDRWDEETGLIQTTLDPLEDEDQDEASQARARVTGAATYLERQLGDAGLADVLGVPFDEEEHSRLRWEPSPVVDALRALGFERRWPDENANLIHISANIDRTEGFALPAGQAFYVQHFGLEDTPLGGFMASFDEATGEITLQPPTGAACVVALVPVAQALARETEDAMRQQDVTLAPERAVVPLTGGETDGTCGALWLHRLNVTTDRAAGPDSVTVNWFEGWWIR